MWKLSPLLPGEASYCIAQPPSAKGETDLGESVDAPEVTNANKELEQAESHMPLWPLRSELAL